MLIQNININYSLLSCVFKYHLKLLRAAPANCRRCVKVKGRLSWSGWRPGAWHTTVSNTPTHFQLILSEMTGLIVANYLLMLVSGPATIHQHCSRDDISFVHCVAPASQVFTFYIDQCFVLLWFYFPDKLRLHSHCGNWGEIILLLELIRPAAFTKDRDNGVWLKNILLGLCYLELQSFYRSATRWKDNQLS